MPPHTGHAYLVEVARRLCDDLTIVVGTLAREPIPGELRAAWMRAIFPDLRVVHLTDENPQDPSEHADFWDIWRASLLRVLPRPPDIVFTSDPYGARLAEVLGARWIPVDPGRTARPICASEIRADPFGHWDFLPPPVRPYYLRRVSVFGPESTGKTSLAAQLAERYQTVWVPEYARTHLEAHRITAPSPADLAIIAGGQVACEDALALEARRLLITDTDPLLTCVWSEVLFGAVPPALAGVAAGRRYDLTLLLEVDLPWIADPVRYLPGERRGFFERCAAALDAAGRRTVVIRGDGAARLAAAAHAIEEVIR